MKHWKITYRFFLQKSEFNFKHYPNRLLYFSLFIQMLESLQDSLEPNSEESSHFLEIVREIFTSAFGAGKEEEYVASEFQEIIVNTQS